MAAAVGSSKASVASDDDSTIKVAPKKVAKDKPAGKIKLKTPAPKQNKPGNWRDGSVIDDKKGTDTPSTNSVPASPGPVVNQLDDSARETFPTGRPLEDTPELQTCKICKKSVLKTAIAAHVEACVKLRNEKLKKKREQKEAREREKKMAAKGEDKDKDKDEEGDTKMEDEDEDEDVAADKKGPGGLKSAKKSAGKKIEVDDNKKCKKRKADGDAEKGPKQKKKKEEPKPKAPKQKGPVDVERQCGVIKDGVPCARSLTCKSHSMGAKRAVAGRSLPYDMLLAAYQKKNQAKQQKAAIDANAPLEDEDAGQGPVDSDEELTAVMHGLSNWTPQPVVPPLVHEPIEKKYMRQRLYEQLHNATNGFTVNIFKVVGYGAQTLPPGHPGLTEQEGYADGEMDIGQGLGIGMNGVAARRASGFNMQLPPQRRPSGTTQQR